MVKAAECGWNVKAGDAEGLAELVIRLSQTDKTELQEKGKRGKTYYDQYFTKEKCLLTLDKLMNLD